MPTAQRTTVFGVSPQDHQRLAIHFEQGLRDLALVDIERANECDVRMGTFTLCAAFIDALSLAYSAKVPPKDLGDKWAAFMERYFGEEYRPVWRSYGTLRSRLLHNYTAPGLGFTHGDSENESRRHLKREDGLWMLHRESFVADVSTAFEKFYEDVREDDDLGARVLRHLDTHPPMGVWETSAPADRTTSIGYSTTRLNVSANSASAAPAVNAPNRSMRRAKRDRPRGPAA